MAIPTDDFFAHFDQAKLVKADKAHHMHGYHVFDEHAEQGALNIVAGDGAYIYDTAQGAFVQTLFKHPRHDAEGVRLSPDQSQVVAVRYTDDISRYAFTHEATEQRAAQVALALRGDQAGTHTVIIETGFAAIKVGVAVIQAVADQTRLVLFGGQLVGQHLSGMLQWRPLSIALNAATT